MLLDTGSTVHLFMNRSTVSNITLSCCTLCLNTNGGISINNKQSLCNDLVVWHNESVISNVLNHGLLMDKYRAVAYSAHHSSIFVTKTDSE